MRNSERAQEQCLSGIKKMISDRRIVWTRIFVTFLFVVLPTSTVFGQQPQKNITEPSLSDTPAQLPSPNESNVGTKETTEPPGGNRVFGVLPNYRTVDESQVTGPLTVGQKFKIVKKDSFDFPLILVAAGLAGIGQWSNQNPSFRQGMAGFSKRFVTAFADQALGNVMTEGLFPTVLHQDPRYYRRGTGSTWSRTGYAFSRLFVSPTDFGGRQFNYSEWVGNATATAISNAYYPDARTAKANVSKLTEQIGLDGLDLILKELWPDIRQKFFQRHDPPRSAH
jgi:hypothetical protein